MKIVLAPDSFKGSLKSIEIIDIIKKAAAEIFPDAEIIGIPIADGGEGSIESILYGSAGKTKKVSITGPLGNSVEAEYGILGETAVIEMANCSGLTLVPYDKRNPLKTTSYGTGQMIKSVLDEGISNILIGIGGSATNDGGMGAMQALGAEFIDKNGKKIKDGTGENLLNVNKIDISGLDKRLKDCCISVMCDVKNPLTGKEGATFVYGWQKGGTDADIEALEKGMQNYEKQLINLFGSERVNVPGAGAAGGMGAALSAFCEAELVSGIDAVLKIKNFNNIIKDADLVITGEGRVDSQSVFGKAVQGVAAYAQKEDIPVICIAGSKGAGYESVYEHGVTAVFTLPDSPMELDECMANAADLLKKLCRDIFDVIKAFKAKA